MKREIMFYCKDPTKTFLVKTVEAVVKNHHWKLLLLKLAKRFLELYDESLITPFPGGSVT